MKKIMFFVLTWVLLNTIAYLFLFKNAYLISWGIFGVLITLLLSLLASLLVLIIILILKNFLGTSNHSIIRAITLVSQFALTSLVLILLQVIISQNFVYVPGNNSLNGITNVELNDTSQTIIVRGTSETNPVILFLAGGPGGSQVQATREFLSDLEESYTIVNWEQPGSGKSYNARPIKSLEVNDYVEDAHALTEYLKDRFNQEKIYIIGESWGSYLGVLLASQYPNDYHALITTGQMVDFAETEQYCYDEALRIARERNDTQQIKALENLTEVPVTGDNITMEVGTYLIYLHHYMSSNANINRVSWSTFDSLFSPEYSIIDSFNFIRALYFTFSQIFQQLYEVDLRETHTEFSIPIYILHGRHDVNAPTYLVDDYFELINAPEKELIYFEASGHNPWITESELFQETVLEILGE